MRIPETQDIQSDHRNKTFDDLQVKFQRQLDNPEDVSDHEKNDSNCELRA